jgi:hypothetical protein
MQNRDLRLNQAEHNQDACLKLDTVGCFPDWVVTTAFYSAVHYIQYKLFPLTGHDGTKLVMHQTFIDYNETVNPHNSKSRHNIMLMLVKHHAKNIEPEYRALYDNCLTARYSDYRISPDVATMSKEDLASIKSYCNPVAKEEENTVLAADVANKQIDN